MLQWEYHCAIAIRPCLISQIWANVIPTQPVIVSITIYCSISFICNFLQDLNLAPQSSHSRSTRVQGSHGVGVGGGGGEAI